MRRNKEQVILCFTLIFPSEELQQGQSAQLVQEFRKAELTTAMMYAPQKNISNSI